MSRAFIRSLSGAIKNATEAQELLMKQKNPSEDIIDAIERMDSIINVLHGLREEEKEIAQFEGQFLESRFEEEELDEEDE